MVNQAGDKMKECGACNTRHRDNNRCVSSVEELIKALELAEQYIITYIPEKEARQYFKEKENVI